MQFINTIACGFAVGVANMVPGVSGGTMAFVLGIYGRLIGALSHIDADAVRMALRFDVRGLWKHTDATFLIVLGIGVVGAVAFFTRVIDLPALLQSEPEAVYALFFGLVAASVVELLKDARGFTLNDALATLAGVAAGWYMVNIVPVETPETWWFVLLCGFIAISTMLLPGVSGSFLLLMLNKYAYIFNAVGELNMTVIVPFAAGLVLGLLTFARVFRWLLGKFPRGTLRFICGLLIGSLWKIWPFQERVYAVVRDKERLMGSTPVWPSVDASLWVPIVLAIAGAAVVFVISALASRREATA